MHECSRWVEYEVRNCGMWHMVCTVCYPGDECPTGKLYGEQEGL